MTLNNEYGGYMNSYSDSDFYKITTSSTGKLSIKFNHTYVDNSSVWWNVYIYYYMGGTLTELTNQRIYGTGKTAL